jgi:hypothetical protein
MRCSGWAEEVKHGAGMLLAISREAAKSCPTKAFSSQHLLAGERGRRAFVCD